MLDSMFQEGTDKALDDRVARPLPELKPSSSFSVWRTAKAPFAGVGAGANESAGFLSDMLGAFGSVQAGYGMQADPSLIFSPDEMERRKQAGEKARKEIDSGAAFSTEIGTNFRATARSFMPDPATSNVVENTLFGLTRFGVKAVGYSLAGGPLPGAALTAADEGMTEADRLKAEGVDIRTRTKVGVISGAVAGAATVMPLAGATKLQTAGLVAAGGPGGFIAQQAASKAILEHANYQQLADQYDPFDPVGLAVSTLVPAAFGVHGYRANLKAATKPAPVDAAAARELASMGGNERLALKHDDPRLDAYAVTAAQREGIPPEALLAIKNAGERSASTAVSPKGAKGVMQFMPDTWATYGKGDIRDPIASIDAGAAFMKDLIKQYDGDVRAAIAHYNGGGKAGEAVRAGNSPPAAETQKYLDRTDAYIAEKQGTEAGKAAATDPEAVAAARVQQVRDQIADSGLHDPADIVGAEEHAAAVAQASDQMAAGERVNVSDILSADRITREPPIKIESLPSETTHQAPPLSENERAVEARFAQQVDTNGDALAADYLKRRGAVIDPDLVKAFSEDYAADPARYANAVHEPSSKLAKLIYAKALAAIKPGDRVLFTAGGGGSGKSESLDRHLASGKRPAVIYDSTLSSAESAGKRIDQALEAGAKVDILYTNRQVEKAFEFSLKRPRAIPADVLAKAHVGASDTIRALAEKYKGNPNVDIRIMNNLTDSLHDIKPGKLADVPKYNYNDIERGLYENARRKLQSGDISQERFNLTVRGNHNGKDLGSPTSGSRSQPENNVRGTGGHPRPDGSAGPEGQSLPEVLNPATDGKGNSTPSILDTQTAEIARLSPDLMVQLEGMDAPMRLADALEAVRAEAARDVEDAPLLQVAAECFLRSS